MTWGLFLNLQSCDATQVPRKGQDTFWYFRFQFDVSWNCSICITHRPRVTLNDLLECSLISRFWKRWFSMQPKADKLDKERQRVNSALWDSSPARRNNTFMSQLCYEYSNTASNIALEIEVSGARMQQSNTAQKKKWRHKETRAWSLPGISKYLSRVRLLHWNLAHISHSLNDMAFGNAT